jgi:hypothetical protein
MNLSTQMSAEEGPRTFSILLEPEQSVELSTVSDAKFVGAQDIGGCRVSTTVSDVRYGRYVDGIDGEARVACVIVLKFGFAGHWSKRIKKVKVSLCFSASQPASASSDGDASEDAVPELRLWEPSSGRSQTTSVRTTLAKSASASLGINSGTRIGGDLSRSIETEKIASASLTSVKETLNTVSWDLKENTQEKQGIPSELNCAVVIRTDEVQFTASVKFIAQIRGKYAWYRGTKTSLIDSSYLQNRQSPLSAEEVGLLNDMDSDKFTEWIKSKANNGWIVMS